MLGSLLILFFKKFVIYPSSSWNIIPAHMLTTR
jgi:hypothetical protein